MSLSADDGAECHCDPPLCTWHCALICRQPALTLLAPLKSSAGLGTGLALWPQTNTATLSELLQPLTSALGDAVEGNARANTAVTAAIACASGGAALLPYAAVTPAGAVGAAVAHVVGRDPLADLLVRVTGRGGDMSQPGAVTAVTAGAASSLHGGSSWLAAALRVADPLPALPGPLRSVALTQAALKATVTLPEQLTLFTRRLHAGMTPTARARALAALQAAVASRWDELFCTAADLVGGGTAGQQPPGGSTTGTAVTAPASVTRSSRPPKAPVRGDSPHGAGRTGGAGGTGTGATAAATASSSQQLVMRPEVAACAWELVGAASQLGLSQQGDGAGIALFAGQLLAAVGTYEAAVTASVGAGAAAAAASHNPHSTSAASAAAYASAAVAYRESAGHMGGTTGSTAVGTTAARTSAGPVRRTRGAGAGAAVAAVAAGGGGGGGSPAPGLPVQVLQLLGTFLVDPDTRVIGAAQAATK